MNMRVDPLKRVAGLVGAMVLGLAGSYPALALSPDDVVCINHNSLDTLYYEHQIKTCTAPATAGGTAQVTNAPDGMCVEFPRCTLVSPAAKAGIAALWVSHHPGQPPKPFADLGDAELAPLMVEYERTSHSEFQEQSAIVTCASRRDAQGRPTSHCPDAQRCKGDLLFQGRYGQPDNAPYAPGEVPNSDGVHSPIAGGAGT